MTLLRSPLPSTSAPVLGPARVAGGLSTALAGVAAVAAALTFFADGILTGPAVAVGNARGTSLVLLVAGVPTLVVATGLARRGSARAVLVWLGTLAYLVYNGVMLLFATPFNHLFLLYVALLSLAGWTAVFAVRAVDRDALAARCRPGLPARALGAYLVTVAVLNALIWLRTAVPASLSAEPTAFLAEVGLTTSPSFVQDLAFWLPLMALAGVLLWRRTGWGYLTAGTMLTYGVLEAVGVAVDQWFGYRADPTTSYASLGGMWLFVGLSAVALTTAYLFLRAVDRPAVRE